jgi:hypothetical protein
VSKRHQANRRKTYGRRQHEVRQRRTRELVPAEDEPMLDDLGPVAAMPDRLAFLDPRTPRLRFALGD